jgi:TonB family protein
MACRCRIAAALVFASLTPTGWSQPSRNLAAQYGAQKRVLEGSFALFRAGAAAAPLPEYPLPARKARRQGLVVVELAVAPSGAVVDTNVLESFDAGALATVTATLRTWRFRSLAEVVGRETSMRCPDCFRVNRLAFDFRIERGRAYVVDLAAAEIARRHLSDPYGRETAGGTQ